MMAPKSRPPLRTPDESHRCTKPGAMLTCLPTLASGGTKWVDRESARERATSDCPKKSLFVLPRDSFLLSPRGLPPPPAPLPAPPPGPRHPPSPRHPLRLPPAGSRGSRGSPRQSGGAGGETPGRAATQAPRAAPSAAPAPPPPPPPPPPSCPRLRRPAEVSASGSTLSSPLPSRRVRSRPPTRSAG
eukprot:791020-Prorocentrum_minimum.AAC.3